MADVDHLEICASQFVNCFELHMNHRLAWKKGRKVYDDDDDDDDDVSHFVVYGFHFVIYVDRFATYVDLFMFFAGGRQH